MTSNEISISVDSDSGQSSSTDVDSDSIYMPLMPLCYSYCIERPFIQRSVGDSIGWSIYKVPHRLREVNEKAYEPNVISIGPYHYGKPHLKAMEAIKRSCFDKIVEELSLDNEACREAMKSLEEKARRCYEEPFYLESNEFVEMMLLDGCFVVQLIRKTYPEEDYFNLERIQTDVRYDLLLLENQLPFFVLFKLYSIIVNNDGEHLYNSFACSALSLFNKRGRGPEIWSWFKSGNYPFPEKEIKHLLDLVHRCRRPSKIHGVKARAEAKAKQSKSQSSRKFIRSARELEEVGINFFAVRDQGPGLVRLFDIEFREDTQELKIPTLLVDNNTERILRNLMAYEQFIPSKEPRYVSDYVMFMDNVINAGKDVQLLRKSEIIDNCIGDDEAVAQMFNKFLDSIHMRRDFYYAEIFERVNKHCKRKRNRAKRKWTIYKAKLKTDYFNSPWSFISFLAAVALLVLTLIQTIVSVLSYVHQNDLRFP